MQKRKYNVEGSNSLWDIDKNHKLIRLVAICYFALQTEKQPERKQLDFGLFWMNVLEYEFRVASV